MSSLSTRLSAGLLVASTDDDPVTCILKGPEPKHKKVKRQVWIGVGSAANNKAYADDLRAYFKGYL